jgi:hypothetical protein
MKEKVELVKIAYSDLSWEERKEIRDFIENFEKKEYSEKRVINEQLRKSLGPINSGKCDWCGK